MTDVCCGANRRSIESRSGTVRLFGDLAMHVRRMASSHLATCLLLAVGGLNIAYREAGDLGNPKLVLLHGFPSSSHQYRNLLPALANRFHVLSPDYPGFGNSGLPDPAPFSYTFDKISEIVEAFLKLKGFDRYGLFVQDDGGPVGFRIVSRHPEALEWLIIQNTNAYEIGFTPAWDGFRNALWKDRTSETEKPLTAFLEHDAIKTIYLHGARRVELISPDNWKYPRRANPKLPGRPVHHSSDCREKVGDLCS